MTVRDSTPRIHVKMQDAKTIEGGYYKPDVDENGILRWTPSKEHMPELPESNIKGKPGYTPIKGVDYFDGAPGKDGTDANVTTENITRALGYTPADEGDVNQLKYDKLDKEQGTENAGKPMVVGKDGNIIPANIPEKPFVKIADITLAEDASIISITEDMNGNPFALKEIVAKISFPAMGSAKTISVYFGIAHSTGKCFSRVQNTTNAAYGSESRCYAVIKHGRIMNISSAASITSIYHQPVNVNQILQGIGMIEAEKFDKLYVYTYTEGGFPAGSRVVIEGVPM